jgi:hypothetical protein
MLGAGREEAAAIAAETPSSKSRRRLIVILLGSGAPLFDACIYGTIAAKS